MGIHHEVFGSKITGAGAGFIKNGFFSGVNIRDHPQITSIQIGELLQSR